MSYVESAGVITRWTNSTVTSSSAVDTGAIESALTFGTAGAMDPLDDGTLTLLGPPGGWGARRASPVSDDGERVRTVDVPNMAWQPGMGPFFSTVLPDGTVALPQIQLAVNQVTNTGTTMSCGFFHPDHGFYTRIVPTTTGATETLAVNSVSGVVSTAGGADLCDSTLTWDGDTPVLFCLSALCYRGWRISTVGLYPCLAAFTPNATSGMWEYNAARSIWPVTLANSHASGPNVFPTRTNYYGESYVDTLLPAEITTLPVSGHVAISIYAPRSGHNWGSVIAVNTVAKTMTAVYEWPDMTNSLGWGSQGFTRDLNADPTSVANDERIVVNHDLFVQPNETFNVIVYASSGTWRINYGGSLSTSLSVGATAAQVKTALETVVGAGNTSVREARPFLVSTYVIYEIELVGSLAHTDLTATTISVDTASLTGNLGTVVDRWRHGGTGYTMQDAFPFTELSYNAGAGTITAKTVPMLPMIGTEDPVRGDKAEASAAMTWYTSRGDLVVSVGTGAFSNNPNMYTVFQSLGFIVWRSAGAGVDRSYVAASAPTTGWQNRFGEARPSPDLDTYAVHLDSNAFMLTLAEDQATGAVVAASSSGKLLAAQPNGRWAARSSRFWAPTFSSTASVTGTWTASGTGHTVGYSAGETAMQFTSGSTVDGVLQTATGTSGRAVPAEYVGEAVTFSAETKAATTGRLVRLACRFWNSGGGEVGSLSGYGASVAYNRTSGYRWIVGSAVIPAGTAYLSFQVEFLGPANGEVHYVRTVNVQLAPYWATPAKVDLGTSPLYTGQTGGTWAAKGFVDPETRMLWTPYLQVMAETTARNTRYPSWLSRVSMADLFPLDRTIGPLDGGVVS